MEFYFQFWIDLRPNNEAHNNNKNNSEKSNSEMHLSRRSKQTRVHWTSLPPNEEKLECQKYSDKKPVDTSSKDDVLNSTNLVSLKERINQLKIDNSAEQIINKKPTIMPKPIISKNSKPIDSPSVTKVRGKLDKSFSTPSYDFSGDGNIHNNFEYFDSDLRMSVEDIKNYDTDEVTSNVTNKDKIKRPDKPVLIFPKPPPPPRNDDIHSNLTVSDSTSVSSINNKSVKPILHFPKPPPPKSIDIDFSKMKESNIINNFELDAQDCETLEQASSRTLEPGNRFVFDSQYNEHLERQNENSLDYDNITMQLSEDKVPVSLESTKYLINRLTNKSYSNKQQDVPDFEKNSLSDLSDVCPPFSLTDLSGSDDNIFRVDTKDNISLPSERTAVTPHQVILNAPATFPRQKTETKKSQPPIPPPRPSKPTELPKRTSYRAMLGAKAIGKKENKGQKQLFQRNPLINSNFLYFGYVKF